MQKYQHAPHEQYQEVQKLAQNELRNELRQWKPLLSWQLEEKRAPFGAELGTPCVKTHLFDKKRALSGEQLEMFGAKQFGAKLETYDEKPEKHLQHHQRLSYLPRQKNPKNLQTKLETVLTKPRKRGFASGAKTDERAWNRQEKLKQFKQFQQLDQQLEKDVYEYLVALLANPWRWQRLLPRLRPQHPLRDPRRWPQGSARTLR